MADYEQLPGNLNIYAVVGDDISIPLDFDVALTGYTFSAKIIVQQAGTVKEQDITVTGTNLAAGQITLSLTDAQTTNLGAINARPWYLTWTAGSTTTTVLSGTFTLKRRT